MTAPGERATRRRIIDAALRCFAEYGFEATTNRAVAETAGVSTGPIYHYFDSKAALYAAVHHTVQVRMYERFEAAAATADGFVAKFGAVLESAHELNLDDPTIAVFIASSSVDLRRSAELAAAVPRVDHLSPDEFFGRMIGEAIDAGEFPEAAREAVTLLVRVVASGLTDAMSGDAALHRDAVDGVKALLAGRLVGPVVEAERSR